MIFTVALDAAGAPTEGLLRAELLRRVRDLRLEVYCAAGGAVDWSSIEISALHVEANDRTINVRGALYFLEISYGGCAATEIYEEREVPLRIEIERATGIA